MPQLKAVLESLDETDEAIRDYYKKVTVKGADGKAREQYELDTEGTDNMSAFAPLKNAHERVKAELIAAKAKLAELETKHVDVPEDFTAEEWLRLKAVDETIKKNPDDPDKRKQHEAEVQSIKAMHEQTIARIKAKSEKELAEEKASHVLTKSSLRARVVGDDLRKALIEAGADKRYLKAASAMLERSIKVKEENGNLIAMVETDLGEVPIDQFIPQWANSEEGKNFITQAKGSDAPGSGSGSGSKGSLDANPWAKASWNQTVQGQVLRQDAGKADRLAKVAGHKGAAGARVEDAK